MKTAHDSLAVAWLLRELGRALDAEDHVGWYAGQIVATQDPDLFDYALYNQGWARGYRYGEQDGRDRLLHRGGTLRRDPDRQAKRKRERKARRKARGR